MDHKLTQKKLQRRTKTKEDDDLLLLHNFTELLSRDALYIVIEELLKHCLYMRYQIPSPYVMLLHEVSTTKRDAERNPHVMSRCGSSKNKRLRKKTMFIDSLNNIFDSLKFVLRHNTVLHVVLLFGSTIVSPKESIVIKIKTMTEARSTDDRHGHNIGRKFMRAIVTDGRLNALKRLNPSNIIVLINTVEPIDIHDTFSPRQHFKMSKRGTFYTFTLDYTDEIKDVTRGENCSSSSGDFLVEEFSKMEINQGEKQEDTYWYTSKVPLKGFKEMDCGDNNGSAWL